MEQGSGLTISDEKTVQKLMKSKQEFKTELADYKEQLWETCRQKTMLEERILRAEADMVALQQEYTKMKTALISIQD